MEEVISSSRARSSTEDMCPVETMIAAKEARQDYSEQASPSKPNTAPSGRKHAVVALGLPSPADMDLSWDGIDAQGLNCSTPLGSFAARSGVQGGPSLLQTPAGPERGDADEPRTRPVEHQTEVSEHAPSRRRLPSGFCKLPPQEARQAKSGGNLPQNKRMRFTEAALYPVIEGRLYFSAHTDDQMTMEQIQSRKDLFFWSTDLQEQYEPFCADFGPVDLGMVFRFCKVMNDKINHPKLQQRPIVYYCSAVPEHIANACFLMAAYLVIEKDCTAEQAAAPFKIWQKQPFHDFRDATFSKSQFDLTIQDCCAGLQKALKLGWLDPQNFCLDEFEFLYAEDLDLSKINNKLYAFRGPSDEEGEHSPPEHFVPVFQELGITAVVRLNESDTYEASVFEQAGIKHHDLYFDDCTIPCDEIIKKFLDICDAEDGAIAVHCFAGLGRTGTLIALWMMRNYGFTARECIGWLRVCRPGSVIGLQQPFLCAKETQSGRGWVGNQPPLTPEWDTAVPAQLANRLANEVKTAVLHRSAARDD